MANKSSFRVSKNVYTDSRTCTISLLTPHLGGPARLSCIDVTPHWPVETLVNLQVRTALKALAANLTGIHFRGVKVSFLDVPSKFVSADKGFITEFARIWLNAKV